MVMGNGWVRCRWGGRGNTGELRVGLREARGGCRAERVRCGWDGAGIRWLGCVRSTVAWGKRSEVIRGRWRVDEGIGEGQVVLARD